MVKALVNRVREADMRALHERQSRGPANMNSADQSGAALAHRPASALLQQHRNHSFRHGRPQAVAEMKARQSSKIKELGDALVVEGLVTLDQQADALGLSRSTTWTILKANHKASGLSATIINRMLAAPRLPMLARAKLLEYIGEKSAGLYGGSKIQLRRFANRVISG